MEIGEIYKTAKSTVVCRGNKFNWLRNGTILILREIELSGIKYFGKGNIYDFTFHTGYQFIGTASTFKENFQKIS